MQDYDVPDSLREWAELNEQADEADRRGDVAAWAALGKDIEDAWYAAPWQDRARVDWELLKQVWRDRRRDQLAG